MTTLLAPLAPYLVPSWACLAVVALCRAARRWAASSSRRNLL
jgi:hypothetical protein